jgi:HK97 family phage major capsid protein
MKKLVVFLAAYLTFKKGQQAELDEKDADEVIKAGKAVEVIVDKSLDQRDHATTPGLDEEAMAKAVATATAKAIEPLQKKLEEQSEQLAKFGREKATNNVGAAPNPDAPAPLHARRAADGSGISFVRIAKGIAMVHLKQMKGEHITLEKQLEKWGYKDEVDALKKAFTASSLSDGGSLIPEVFATEVIELLRHRTAIRKLGYRQMDLSGGNLTIGRQSGAATAAYVAEGAVITTSKPSTEQVRLSAKKLASLVPVSNDLIRQATPSAEEFVRQDLLKVMALREDLAFARGDGQGDTPKGLRYDTNAANVYAATAVAPKLPTLAEVRTELAKAKYSLNKNDVPVPVEELAWVISPRTRYYLELLQDGNGNNAIFATELAQGKLWGIPFVDTTQIPDNLGGGDESEIYLYNKTEFMIGDHMQLEVTVAPNGTYEEGGVAKSGLSRDETPIRVISAHDCKLRHNVSAAVVTTVRWGAP